MINTYFLKLKNIFDYKIVRYGFVGGISTLIHVLVASGYIYYTYDSVIQSNIVGFLVAYVFSYIVQSKLVFKHDINIKKAIKYFIVQFTALLLAIFSSGILNEYNSYIKTLIVAMLLPFITFFIHKIWTFND